LQYKIKSNREQYKNQIKISKDEYNKHLSNKDQIIKSLHNKLNQLQNSPNNNHDCLDCMEIYVDVRVGNIYTEWNFVVYFQCHWVIVMRKDLKECIVFVMIVEGRI